MGLLDNVFAATPRKTNPAAYGKWIGGKLIDEAGNVVMEAPSLGNAAQAINSFMPIAGDIQSGLLAANDIKNKDYKSAALNSLGLLPFVPSMGGMMASKGGKIADAIRPLTKFEQALLTAQKNAVDMLGLPPNNTAMDRARAMGFDNDLYHGNYPRSTADNPSGDYVAPNLEIYIETKDGIPARSALFTSTSSDVANGYALPAFSGEYTDGSVLFPLKAKIEKEAWTNANGQHWSSIGIGKGQIEANARAAKKQGYDAYRIKNVNDQGTILNSTIADTVALLKGKNIRSRFAAFDPAKRNSSDMLGYITPEMMGLLAAGSAGGIAYARDKKKAK